MRLRPKSLLATLCAVLFASRASHGATVIWDAFELYYGGEGAYGLQYSGYAHTPAMGFQLTHEFDWDRVHAVVPDNQTLNEGNPYAYWIVANAGDLVTMANVLEKEAIFDLAFTSGEWKTSDFWADKGQTFYLALLSGRENTLYCWISMYVDEFGSFSLLHSAISDEPGIIVGQLPEPEPAGGTLAVIGFAVLMLRRRHKVGLLS